MDDEAQHPLLLVLCQCSVLLQNDLRDQRIRVVGYPEVKPAMQFIPVQKESCIER